MPTPNHSWSRAALTLAAALTALVASGAEPLGLPRFTHPGAGQTLYFLLTDRFANGRTDNDTGGFGPSADVNGFDPTRLSHFHGGDFAGLTARLDYLKNLGITAVWVTPPFKNKPMQSGTAGYHGYWITDFTQIDPHLGTNDEFRAFVAAAHARGLRVYMDIIANHTADVLTTAEGGHAYRPIGDAPYRDAAGRPFDATAAAWNGLGDPAAFPALSPERSFAYRPVAPAAEADGKRPAWLNDPTLYHNRGNSTFVGENSVHGDFAGLDDLFTEHPRVVGGLTEIFRTWLETGVDGYRIDTVRHVNNAFWQAFAPAIRARARELGRTDFLQFGEVYNDAGDPAVLSEFSTHLPLDATLDFGFFAAARRFVSQHGTAAALADFFARDDYYTDHDSNVHATTTFLGNHDAGRFAYFLQQDNPGATPDRLAALSALGHGLLLLARGQPVLYYGDEQGMIGRGGNDMQAREDMFASRTPDFATAPLLGTARTGADDKFDPTHPLYRLCAQLTALRAAHPALRTGAMVPRPTGSDDVFAFSRLERRELVEYVAVFNGSRTQTLRTAIPTSQPAGARLTRLFASPTADAAAPADSATNAATTTIAAAAVDAEGRLPVTLAPLQFAVWRATAPLGATAAPTIALSTPAAGAALPFATREVDGLSFPTRQEIRAEVGGGDGVAEVTFTLRRASRPHQAEWLGTDDAAPYRIFWRPPPDLAPGERFAIVATVNDLRGHVAVAEIAGLSVAPTAAEFGIRGATTPMLAQTPPPRLAAARGETITLAATATGTAPLEYHWLRDDEEVAGATSATWQFALSPATAGEYRVLVRNRAGTTLGAPTTVEVRP